MPKPNLSTYTGKNLLLFELTPHDIDIEDIAHGLACINRFNGQVKKPISVAQHSVYVARIAMKLSGPRAGLQGLLHDASEAYIGDMTKWLKQAPEMKEFRIKEARIQHTIYRRFRCRALLYSSVEYADRIMVRYEGMRGYKQPFIDHPDYPPLTKEEKRLVGPWGFWSWQSAESIFLTEYEILTHELYA